MDYFLVIDAGTGSGRAVLFDEEGNQLSMAQKEWKHLNLTGVRGAIDFDTKENWKLIKKLIIDVIKATNVSPNDIKAVSSTSMREGIVFYNTRGDVIWACSNIDARANDEVCILKEKGFEKQVYDQTGQTFSISDVPRLLWIKRNQPEIYKEIASLGMISDWIIYMLSGEFTFEPSNGSTSGIFHTFDRCWDERLINTLELPTDIYPKVYEPGTVVGTIRPELAEEVGLTKDTLIVVGGGDAQIGSLGVGAVKEGDVVILGGTFWQQEVNVKKPIPHPEAKVRINAHIIKNLWQYEGISFQIGLVMRWFRDAFCHREKSIARELGISTYSLLDELTKNIPIGSYGIVPVFSDIMNYINWKHASPALMNFDINQPEKYSKAAVFKALMENAAFNSFGNLKLIAEVSGFYPEEITFAGGASYSPVWCKIMANVLGVPVRVPKVKEATALGAFLCAAVGTENYNSFKEAKEKVCKYEVLYLPDVEEHQEYKKHFDRWQKTYKEVMKLADEGVLNYMWKAPGV